MEEVDNVKIEDFIELKEVNQEKKFSNVTFCNRNVSLSIFYQNNIAKKYFRL